MSEAIRGAQKRRHEPVGSQPSLTRRRRFRSTPIPSLNGVQPSLTRGRRFDSTALPLFCGATGTLLGEARHRER